MLINTKRNIVWVGIYRCVSARKRDVSPVRQQWSYVFLALTHRYIECNVRVGPCITNVIATCRKNFSQWESSFLWKLRCHWLKFLRRVAKTLVIQGPGVVSCFCANESGRIYNSSLQVRHYFTFHTIYWDHKWPSSRRSLLVESAPHPFS